MAQVMTNRGYYSVMKWAADPTRGEARNVAVVLVDAEGQFGGLRAAPPSAVAGNLRAQGILDSVIHGLETRFDSENKPDLRQLHELYESLDRSLFLTEPKPVAVSDTGATLRALYRAFVAHKAAPRTASKAVVLGQVVNAFRKWGATAQIGEYVDDYLFDAVLANGSSKRTVVEVLTFATGTRDWSLAEKDAGHFVFAVDQTELPAAAIVSPPNEASKPTASTSYKRVMRWFDRAGIPAVEPERIEELRPVVLSR